METKNVKDEKEVAKDEKAVADDEKVKVDQNNIEVKIRQSDCEKDLKKPSLPVRLFASPSWPSWRRLWPN